MNGRKTTEKARVIPAFLGTYKTKRKLVDVIEIGSKFPNVVATIFAYVSLGAVSRSLRTNVVTGAGKPTAVTERRTRIFRDGSSTIPAAGSPRARNRTNAVPGSERGRRTGGSKKKIKEKGTRRRTGIRSGRKKEKDRDEERQKQKRGYEIWAVLEGVPAYPIGYASVTATFTMSGYTRPRTSLGRTFSYTCTRIVFASTLPCHPLHQPLHPLAKLRFFFASCFLRDPCPSSSRDFFTRLVLPVKDKSSSSRSAGKPTATAANRRNKLTDPSRTNTRHVSFVL